MAHTTTKSMKAAAPPAGASAAAGSSPDYTWGSIAQVWDRGAEGNATQIVTFANGNTMAIWNPVNGSGIWTSIKRHGGTWMTPRMVGSAILGPSIVTYANRILMFWENSTGAYSRSFYSGGSSGPLGRHRPRSLRERQAAVGPWVPYRGVLPHRARLAVQRPAVTTKRS